MPDIGQAVLDQTAVLWAFSTYGVDGEPKVIAPVQISCRWEFTKNAAATAQSNVVSKGESLFVDREIAIDSILLVGELEDIAGTGTGLLTPAELSIVTDYQKIPDIKGRKFVHKVSVKKYSKTLPTVV